MRPWRNLRAPVGDARAISDALTEMGGRFYSDVHPQLLTKSEATREGVIAAFERVAAQSSSQDVFALFFSGHSQSNGDGTFGLVLSGIHADTTAVLTGEELQLLLARIPARRQILLLDAGASEVAFLASLRDRARRLVALAEEPRRDWPGRRVPVD